MTDMLQIGNKVIGLSLLEEKFLCDLQKCKGACCVQGDAGAPLLDEELPVLDSLFSALRSYLRGEALSAIEENGMFVTDPSDGEKVTPLLNGKECVYAVFEEGVARCAIEKAWFDGVISFRKPVSCHLYPIRVKEYENFIAVNYDRWPVCSPAIPNGRKHEVPVFVFCREALIRRFGKEFYKELETAAATFSEGAR